MKKHFIFSPTLFLISELLMLFPSILFLFGLIRYGVFENILITIIGPGAGGFVAYNYLERYKLDDKTRKIAKAIIAYSIVEIGIIVFSTLAT